MSEDLQQRAASLLSDANSGERGELLRERDELADCAWLAGIKDDVIVEIGRRAEVGALRKAAMEMATNRITAKSIEVAETLVTNALRARFAKEVDRLGVAGLAIELRQEKATQGVPLFRVRLFK